jgi:hypothetical protein
MIEQSGRVCVTCEAILELEEGMDQRRAEEIIDDLCHILSVARGTKVQWIYFHECDSEGRAVRRCHRSRITRAYKPSGVVFDGFTGFDQTKQFVESVYPSYVVRREAYRLNRGLIDAYLESKATDDLIERRAIKLTVSLEMLKNLFLTSPGSSVREFVIDKNRFKRLTERLRTAIKEVLRGEDLEPEYINSMCAKINELNRTSFKEVLIGLFNEIGFSPEQDEISLFVRCRNALVHTGQFYQPGDHERRFLYFSPPSSEERAPETDYLAGYLFVLNFLDRVFLKLLGYSGHYINWKSFSPTSQGTGVPDNLD